MTKEQKLSVLDEIIIRARLASCESDNDMTQCEDDVKTFVRNVMPESSWIERIENIRWPSFRRWTNGTLDSAFVRAWSARKTEFIGVLNSIRNEIEFYTVDSVDVKSVIRSDKVFVVHGHNEMMKFAVSNMITKIGLNPIILHEQPNKGRTIIEKFEKLSQDIGFAIILLSADDKVTDITYRARQNVIFELGYFIAKLGRENVVALYDTSSGEIETPGDISGVIYEPYDNPNGSWRLEVVQELQSAGFSVDANSLI